MKLPLLDYACPTSLADALASAFANLPGAAAIARAEAAAAAAVDPPDDIHAAGAYRKTLLGVMLERALRSARS